MLASCPRVCSQECMLTTYKNPRIDRVKICESSSCKFGCMIPTSTAHLRRCMSLCSNLVPYDSKRLTPRGVRE